MCIILCDLLLLFYFTLKRRLLRHQSAVCNCCVVVVDPCTSNPCLNGGTCRQQQQQPSSYVCTCHVGMLGDRCQYGAYSAPPAFLVASCYFSLCGCLFVCVCSSVYCLFDVHKHYRFSHCYLLVLQMASMMGICPSGCLSTTLMTCH